MTAGLSLICDTTPEKDVGGPLGLAMMGLPIGSLVGPPVGGALYARWGYRAPFIFTIIFTALDFGGRLSPQEEDKRSEDPNPTTTEVGAGAVTTQDHEESSLSSSKELSVLGVVFCLLTSIRTLVALSVVFFCSLAFSAADITIPLRLQSVWDLNSTKVS
ncbi:hypothetical protein AcV7_007326 [Taiwanofungus camphoratus]|nr:hypothetical protein AcV7_007326 [Antrodia cinnamomea]